MRSARAAALVEPIPTALAAADQLDSVKRDASYAVLVADLGRGR